VIALALSAADEAPAGPPDLHQIGVVSHHLYSTKSIGVFLPLEKLDDRALAAAYRQIRRQKISDEPEDEGIVREIATS
jgi:hypothetical protein